MCRQALWLTKCNRPSSALWSSGCRHEPKGRLLGRPLVQRVSSLQHPLDLRGAVLLSLRSLEGFMSKGEANMRKPRLESLDLGGTNDLQSVKSTHARAIADWQDSKE